MQQQELDRLLVDVPRPPPPFIDFVKSRWPAFRWARHTEHLAKLVEQVVAGTLTRLIVQLPPRHHKSTIFSRFLPAYYLRCHPQRWVALASYSSEIAYLNSRAAQAYWLGRETQPLEVEAVKHWETPQHGGLWATGIGGPATGKGFHVGVLDDPIKNAKEAGSPVVRQTHIDWWESVWTTRQEPHAAIVLVLTRWHELDVAGWLMERELEEPEAWHVVDWPALCEPPKEYPPTCTLEPDWRRPGAALWPEQVNEKVLLKKRASISEHWWTALYQQKPHAREGGFFKREWFPIVPTAPTHLTVRCRGWDQAATDQAGDWTAGLHLAKGGDGLYYVLDAIRGQWAPGDRDRILKQTAQLDGRPTWVALEQEPGASGKDAVVHTVNLLAGYSVRVHKTSGDKALRAGAFAAQAQAGNVRLVAGPWNATYLDELAAFPTGTHDDQVDATSIAFETLTQSVAPDVKPVSLTAPSRWNV